MKAFSSLAVVMALATAVFLQAPGEGLNSQAVTGGDIGVPITPCNVTGYDEIDCSFINSNCTAGTVKAANVIAWSTTEDFRSLETTSVRGNCTGNQGCDTPPTSDLTSEGC